jgi:predicted GNAT superfamily acetyltransferase
MAGSKAEVSPRETRSRSSALTTRALTAVDEFQEAVKVQQKVWGFADNELLPVRLFVVATKIGGQVFGTFDGDRLIAFCIAIPGIKKASDCYLHSHMLGVLPEYWNRGIGRTLKLAQREEAMSRGIDLMEWTFDPLEIKNAYFNMERLGAIVRRYVLNQYGTTTSHLHGGLPTDRCVAEWHMQSHWVKETLAGRKPHHIHIEARIEVPANISELRVNDVKRAKEIQSHVTDSFLSCFDQGLAVTAVELTESTGTYLLGKWE